MLDKEYKELKETSVFSDNFCLWTTQSDIRKDSAKKLSPSNDTKSEAMIPSTECLNSHCELKVLKTPERQAPVKL